MKKLVCSSAGAFRCAPLLLGTVLMAGLCAGQQSGSSSPKRADGVMTFPNVRVVSVPKSGVSKWKPQDRQFAAIDPATGQLRPIEQDEVAALSQQVGQASARRIAPRQPIYYGKGMVSLVLEPNELNYATVELQPDGSIKFSCDQGTKSAGAEQKAKSQEVRHEK